MNLLEVGLDKLLEVLGTDPELGLTGEVRAVNFSEKRVLDSIKFGFKTILIPRKEEPPMIE